VRAGQGRLTTLFYDQPMAFEWRGPLWVWLLTLSILGTSLYGVWWAGRFLCRLVDSPCWFIPDAQPSRSYENASALAAALEQGGVPCKNQELTHDRPTFQQIACGGTPNKAFDYLVVVFDKKTRHEWLRRDSMGCSGVVVFGENWHVAMSDPYNVRRIVGAVGGRVVGLEESEDCYD
jgi:hypothetical protein